MKKNILIDILRSPSTVFTFKEILIASGESNPAQLKRRLHYYVQKKQLHPIRRGIYAKDKNYNRFEFATKIYTPSYISFETVLAQAGVVFQYNKTIFAASYKNTEITCDNQTYSFKKLKDEILTNTAGIKNRGNYFFASPERAFLDIVYLNKEYHFDNISLLDREKIQSLLPLYHNKRMIKSVQQYFDALNME